VVISSLAELVVHTLLGVAELAHRFAQRTEFDVAPTGRCLTSGQRRPLGVA
jgi:hypothetical protein